jgi:hypothetical protein
MKKILTLLILVCAFFGSYSANAQFRYGPAVGVNISSLKFKQDLISVDKAVNYTAGIQGEMMFPGIGFGLDLGLLYEQLGANVNLGEKTIWASQGFGRERVYLHYIQIPFHLKFKYTNLNGLEDYIAPFVSGGPDFTLLAAHGSDKAFNYSGGELGLSVAVGAELYRNWQVSAGYTWGMTYSLKTQLLENFSARNRAWNVKVAYFF